MSDETIVCRAALDDRCYGGSPMSRQMPGEDEPVTMAEDGTYDGESIVCDSCYVKLIMVSPSGMGLTHELPAAIAAYRSRS